ncbi:MAG: amidohydrolase [Bacteroidota bacterium]|nr:amidohydrolase [Bacteroidota bacterium]
MKSTFLFILSVCLFFSCKPGKQKADLIIHNAVVYTLDSDFSITDAIAIKDDKILATGNFEELLSLYDATEKTDVHGKFIYPGFIDSHCHFYGYGMGLQEINLVGTKSFKEVIERIVEFTNVHEKEEWIIGRGWDQNDWEVKEYPDNKLLDSLFPNTPVLITRIDGHAALANSTALKRAGINKKTFVNGGELLFIKQTETSKNLSVSKSESKKDASLSGILIDNAVDLVTKVIPQRPEEKIKKALMDAQANCFAVGLTTVDDAGLLKSQIDIIDQMQKQDKLKIRVYAMLSDSSVNYDHYLKNAPPSERVAWGKYKTDFLNVCSFKFYGDGALGSRGACMKKDYADKIAWRGFLLYPIEHYTEKGELLKAHGFQMNSHSIGDSSLKVFVDLYGKESVKNLRWRIEHCQIVSSDELPKFKEYGIIPSVQPTHATSDMYWAENRIGKERLKTAYAFKDLLSAAGLIALGTDFPVEDISPFKTFYAAVFRKDANGFPKGGFQIENALSREEAIKGMTIWGAYANFEEKEKGSLEKGKFADLIILDTDLLKCEEEKVLKTKVIATYIGGKIVYSYK